MVKIWWFFQYLLVNPSLQIMKSTESLAISLMGCFCLNTFRAKSTINSAGFNLLMNKYWILWLVLGK